LFYQQHHLSTARHSNQSQKAGPPAPSHHYMLNRHMDNHCVPPTGLPSK
jgi:hypothetical protein